MKEQPANLIKDISTFLAGGVPPSQVASLCPSSDGTARDFFHPWGMSGEATL